MSEIRHFHFVPVGGTAMVPLAALLLEDGPPRHGQRPRPLPAHVHRSSERLGIPVAEGFSPEHVPADCDAVVVGNAALRDNVEAAEAARRGLPVLSLPQAVRQYLLPGKTSVVITGTHGKTTTSALTAWLLLDSGRDPGFLVGGEMQNLGRGYRRGRGPALRPRGRRVQRGVLRPRPEVPALRAEAPLRRQHRVRPRGPLPGPRVGDRGLPQGRRASCPRTASSSSTRDDPRVVGARRGGARAPSCASRSRIPAPTSRRATSRSAPEGARVHAARGGPADGAPVLAAARAATTCATPSARSRSSAGSASRPARSPARCRASRACGGAWRSRARRTASSSSTTSRTTRPPCAGRSQAARARFPGRRLWALFEPRSNTAGRKMFEDDYADAFAGADALVIAPVFHAEPSAADTRSTARRSSRASRRAGKPAFAPETIAEIPEILRARGARRRRAASDVLGRLRRAARDAARERCEPSCARHGRRRRGPGREDSLRDAVAQHADPSISTSTTSPAESGPTPAGVPVRMRSPGRSVIMRET